MADTIEAHAEELAELITAEQGNRALAVREAAGVSHWLRKMALLDPPETVNQDDGTRLPATRRTPLRRTPAST